MKKIIGVYAIWHQGSEKKYIGSSADVAHRWNNHKKMLRKGNHHSIHLQRAWDKYGEAAFVFELLFECEAADLLALEQAALDLLKPEFNILPVAGSPLGVKRTAEQRAAMSARLKAGPPRRLGTTTSPEGRANIGNGRRGIRTGPPAQSTRDNISAALTGRKLSEQHRRNMSASRRGMKYRQRTPEHCAALSAANTGKSNGPLSQEHKDKIRAGMLRHRAAQREAKQANTEQGV